MLSSQARNLCEDEANTLILSLSGVWEMQTKSQLGKLTFNQSLPEVIRRQQADGLEILPITIQHNYETHHEALASTQALGSVIAVLEQARKPPFEVVFTL